MIKLLYSNHVTACDDHITQGIYNARCYNRNLAWSESEKTLASWSEPRVNLTTPLGKSHQYKGRVACSQQ